MWRKCRTYCSELLMYRKQGEHLTGIHLLIAGFSWAPGRLFLAGWPVSWAVQARHSRHTSWVQLANLFPWVILILLTRDGAAQQIPPLQLWSDDRWSWQYLHHTVAGLWTAEFHIFLSVFIWYLIMRENPRIRVQSHFVNWPLLCLKTPFGLSSFFYKVLCWRGDME